MPKPAGQVWSNDACELRITIPAPGVLVLAMKGHAPDYLLQEALPALHSAFPAGQSGVFFCDGWEITGYETKFRVSMTNLVKSLRPRVKVHVLMRTKLVSMGFSVANLVMGGEMVGHRDHQAFYALVDEKAAEALKIHRLA